MSVRVLTQNNFLVRSDSPDTLSVKLKQIFERMKIVSVMFRDMGAETKAQKVFELLKNHLIKSNEPLEKRHNKPTIIVAESTEEFNVFIGKKDDYNSDIPAFAANVPSTNSIVLNLESIKENSLSQKGEEENAIAATFYLASIHESIHYLGGFNGKYHYKDYTIENLECFNEGCTQYFALSAMKKLQFELYQDLPKSAAGSYSEYISIVKDIEIIVGEKTLKKAFYAGNFTILANAMEEQGFGKDLIKLLLKLRTPMRKSIRNETHGFSLDSVREVRRMVPDGQQDLASRMVLAANMHYRWNLNAEPNLGDVVGVIRESLESNRGMAVYAYRDLMAKATETLARPLQDNNQNLESIGMKFGTNIDSKTSAVIEAATTNWVLSKDGRLPSQSELFGNIQNGYKSWIDSAGVVPTPEIITGQLLETTLAASRQDTHAEDNWLSKCADDFVAARDMGKETKSLMKEVYGHENCAQLAKAVDLISGLNGYGDILVQKASEALVNSGSYPNCGEVYGLVLNSAKVVESIPADNYTQLLDSIPESSGFAAKTLSVIERISTEVSKEMLNELPSYEQDRLNAIENTSSQIHAEKQVATEVFATLLIKRYPSDAIIVGNNLDLIVVTPEGNIRNQETSSNNIASNIHGAVGVRTIDPRKHFKKEGKTVDALGISGDLWSAEYTKEVGLSVNDPFIIDEELREFANYIAGFDCDPIRKIKKLFDLVKSDGELQIRGSMYLDDRLGGSKSPNEVLKDRCGNCIELASLFVLIGEEAFKHDKSVKFVALDVLNTEQRTEIGHACAGILLETDEVEGHTKFNTDWDFRQELLSRLNVRDTPRLKLLIVDPVNNIFDYRFDNVKILDKKQLISAFYSNSGIFCTQRGDAQADTFFEISGKLWPKNPNYLIYLHHKMIADNKFRESINALEQMDPEYKVSWIYQAMAESWHQLENHEMVAKTCEEAIKISNNNPFVFTMMSKIIIGNEDKNRYGIAKKYTSRVIALLREDIDSTTIRRSMGVRDGMELSEEEYSNRIKMKQNWIADAYADLAKILLREDNWRDAIYACKKGLTYDRASQELMVLRQISVGKTPMDEDSGRIRVSIDKITGIMQFDLEKDPILLSTKKDKFWNRNDKSLGTKMRMEFAIRVKNEMNDESNKVCLIKQSLLPQFEQLVLKEIYLHRNDFEFIKMCAMWEARYLQGKTDMQKKEIDELAKKLQNSLNENPLQFNRELLSLLAMMGKHNALNEKEISQLVDQILLDQCVDPVTIDRAPYLDAVRTYVNSEPRVFGKMKRINARVFTR